MDRSLTDCPATRVSLLLALRSEGSEGEAAWSRFFGQYEPLVRCFARRVGAPRHAIDDVVQEVMRSVLSRIHGFAYDADRGRFRSYLYVCSVRAVWKLRKRERSAVEISELRLSGHDPAVSMEWAEAKFEVLSGRALDDASRRYSAPSRRRTFAAFKAIVIDGRPAVEVAGELDMSVEAAQRGSRRVRDYVERRIEELDLLDW